MADFVANTPISRPAPVKAPADVDFNGIMWSDRYGFVFDSDDELEPLDPPPPAPRRGRGAF